MGQEEVYGGIGFALGSVTGARAFRVDSGGWLTGLYYKSRWLPGDNVARCRKGQATRTFSMFGGPNEEPDYDDVTGSPLIEADHIAGCKCGFYGFYEGSNDFNRTENHGSNYVSGIIRGSGLCVIGTRGFRTQHARLLALQISPTVPGFEKVLARYASIPMFGSFADMKAAFPPGDGNDVIQQLPGEGEE
jgi:hypothetical protein